MVDIIKKDILNPIKKIRNASVIHLHIVIFNNEYFPKVKAMSLYEVYVDDEIAIDKKYDYIDMGTSINDAKEIFEMFNKTIKPKSFLTAYTNIDREDYEFYDSNYEFSSYKFKIKGLKHIAISDDIYTTMRGESNEHKFTPGCFSRILSAHYDDNLKASEDFLIIDVADIDTIEKSLVDELNAHNLQDIALEMML